MKVDKLETHDRLENFKQQSDQIGAFCEQIINQRPFGNNPFYIFAHSRTLPIDERYKHWLSGQFASLEEVPSHKMIWQPRLTKPKAQTNSMLFKAYPLTNEVKIIWILPERDLWPQYDKGKFTESNIVAESIHLFQNEREKLEAKEKDDLSDSQIDMIYMELSKEAQKKTKLDCSISE